MKRIPLALAVAAIMSANANAQTNVTIYGVADIGVSRVDTTATEPVWGVTSGQSAGSRIGFRGTEDLGGGLSALFTLENGFNIDNGALGQGGLLFGRQAFVGLKSGFGTVKLGRQYTPLHNAHAVLDPFGINLAGNIQNVFTAHGIRMNNTINLSHQIGAFSGELAYSFGEQAGAFSVGSMSSGAVHFKGGPAYALAVYSRQKVSAATTNETILVGGTYDFGLLKAHLGVAANETDSATIATSGKSRDYLLGATIPAGTGSILASYARHDQRSGPVGNFTSSTGTAAGFALAGAPGGYQTVGVLSGAAIDYDQIAVGYMHPLSKRTTIYTSYARERAKPAGAVDASVFNAGIRHVF